MNRFYCPLLVLDQPAILEGSEAHHLLHVLRAKQGDVVELFDGKGTVAQATVESKARKTATLKLDEVTTFTQQDRLQIIIAAVCPKGDRLTSMVEKLTELGVEQFIPLKTERSVVHPSSSKLEKLNQTVISACKQSGRHFLMSITPIVKWDDFLETAPADSNVVIAHPDQEHSVSCEEFIPKMTGKPTFFCIGPEGGFSDDEVRNARVVRKDVQMVSLGRNILRIETAAMILAGLGVYR